MSWLTFLLLHSLTLFFFVYCSQGQVAGPTPPQHQHLHHHLHHYHHGPPRLHHYPIPGAGMHINVAAGMVSLQSLMLLVTT